MCLGHNASSGCHSHNATRGCHSHTTSGVCDYHNATSGCDAHDNSAVTPPGAPPCPGNIVTYPDPVLDTNDKVQASHINELRAAIDAERARRGFPEVWSGSQVSVGSVIDDRELLSLKEALDEVRVGLTWSYIGDIEDQGFKIKSNRVENIRSNLEVASTECACQCNYACTCNCNYACTCNCNYACTCNCNYGCTCNCNYSCTCDCNYSDKNLKREIRFI